MDEVQKYNSFFLTRYVPSAQTFLLE